MIAPDFRGCSATNLNALKPFIESNHGTDLWTTLAP